MTDDVRNPANAGLLYGLTAIAAHLGIGTRELAHLDAQRAVPTYRHEGRLCASVACLDQYMLAKGDR